MQTRLILDGFLQDGVLWYTRLVDELQSKETRQGVSGALDASYAQNKLLGRLFICSDIRGVLGWDREIFAMSKTLQRAGMHT